MRKIVMPAKAGIQKIILVTGGAGFLGSHLCDELLGQGATVYCIDNLVSGSLINLVNAFTYPTFNFKKSDIINSYTIDTVHEIYNLACPASPLQYQQNPIATWRTNVYGADNMLRLGTAHDAKILQASTSEIYGDPIEHPQTENYRGNVNPIGLRSCYNEGKRAAESLFFDFYRKFATRIKIARLFNIYGPRMQMNDGRVIPNFILQALYNKPLTVQGDGRQTRSFCFVTDIITGIIQLMDDTEDDFTGPVNLGTPDEISILDLAHTIIELIGAKSTINFVEKVADDPHCRKPDIRLAQQTFAFAPRVSLQEGLQLTISYFEKLLSFGNIEVVIPKAFHF